jgi:hypothetical protein
MRAASDPWPAPPADELDLVARERVERARLEHREAFVAVLHFRDVRVDEALLQRGVEPRLGRRAGDDADVLASEVGELLQAVPLTRKPPPSRKISDEKSTSSIRVCVAVVLAQSMSAFPEATIAIRSATVPTIQLTLSSDTPAARPNC